MNLSQADTISKLNLMLQVSAFQGNQKYAGRLQIGEALSEGEYVGSRSNRYRLGVLYGDCVLVDMQIRKVLWSVGASIPGVEGNVHAARMDPAGNFVIEDDTGMVLWSAFTGPDDYVFTRNSWIEPRDDGDAVLYEMRGITGVAVWDCFKGLGTTAAASRFSGYTAAQSAAISANANAASVASAAAAALAGPRSLGSRLVHGQSLTENQMIVSPNGRVKAMLVRGRFSVVKDGQEIWHWGEGDVVRAAMQNDDNFVIYNAAGEALAASDTTPYRDCYLSVEDDGNLLVRDYGGSPKWDIFSGTATTGGVVHFIENAASSAGRVVGSVASAVTSVVSQIPIVGAPLSTVFSASWQLTTAPLSAVLDVAQGERLDKVALKSIEQSVSSVKDVAPYAAMIASMVPGVGSGVAAAIGTAAALMNGQSITDALVAGVAAAVPGGALAAAAVKMGYAGVKAGVTGARLDLGELAKSGLGAVADALGLPPGGKMALLAGVNMVGGLAHGERIDQAMLDQLGPVIASLPLPAAAKNAMAEAGSLAKDLASGARVDQALIARASLVLPYLPVSADFVAQVAAGKVNAQTLVAGLQSGLADKLLTSSGLDKTSLSALTTGLALGTATVKQAQRAVEIAGSLGKLTQQGVDLAKSSPVVAAGRQIAAATQATAGFDLGTGLMAKQASLFDITQARDALDPNNQKGFDMALAQRIGATVTPATAVATLSPAAQAGYAMTTGMVGHATDNKVSMMSTIATIPSASIGARVAVQSIAAARESLWKKILRALGFYRHEPTLVPKAA